MWLGRQSRDEEMPHIFVIGHTHSPNLPYVPINVWRKGKLFWQE